MLSGAFRFTTDVAVKQRRREVSVRVGNVTAGIRGTDFWGRSLAGTEIVCLIEGAVEIAAPAEALAMLDQPRQFYRRVGGQTQPVGFVEPAQLAQWARETDLQEGAATARAGGRFQLELARASDQNAALAVYDRLRGAGYPAEIRPMREGKQLVYSIRIRRLASPADARALAERLRGSPGIDNPKVL